MGPSRYRWLVPTLAVVAAADGLSRSAVAVEPQAVVRVAVEWGGGDGGYELANVSGVVRLVEGCQVDVRGWPAQRVRGEQHPAFEDQVLSLARRREAGQEPFEAIQLQILLGGSTVRFRQ